MPWILIVAAIVSGLTTGYYLGMRAFSFAIFWGAIHLGCVAAAVLVRIG